MLVRFGSGVVETAKLNVCQMYQNMDNEQTNILKQLIILPKTYL